MFGQKRSSIIDIPQKRNLGLDGQLAAIQHRPWQSHACLEVAKQLEGKESRYRSNQLRTGPSFDTTCCLFELHVPCAEESTKIDQTKNVLGVGADDAGPFSVRLLRNAPQIFFWAHLK